ncbi:hypothetical protein V9K67_00940 [Paraflavisolibacter sp. H34]|uniref:hypothetical protein n=1 Tax=Huijunlia imazamoxiresistens TaxID=3127457 RepID=UPI00301AB0FA
MKKFFLILFTVFLFAAAGAQKIAPADLKLLQRREDTLKALAKNLIVKEESGDRMRSDSLFVRTLVRGLQVKHSFYYPFDSVKGISRLYAPDSSFRLFTWSVALDELYNRQRGAIQYKTPDGSLKLVALRDFSEFTAAPLDSLRSKDNWIGAVYYNIIKTQYNGKNYYTLFGIDNYSVRSTRKWIDVLTFDSRNLPVFGGTFSFEQDTTRKPTKARHYIEYSKEASTTVNYDPELNMILFDHLISESNEPDKPHTFVPDGDYEGFQWKNGKWVHIEKVFHQKLEDGQAPVPQPRKQQPFPFTMEEETQQPPKGSGNKPRK